MFLCVNWRLISDFSSAFYLYIPFLFLYNDWILNSRIWRPTTPTRSSWTPRWVIIYKRWRPTPPKSSPLRMVWPTWTRIITWSPIIVMWQVRRITGLLLEVAKILSTLATTRIKYSTSRCQPSPPHRMPRSITTMLPFLPILTRIV